MVRQAKNLKNYTGAMGGIFEPGQLATEIMPDVEYGNLFAYLFRRFGYPLMDWDDHKELCGYILTTKIKGVYLDVSPRPSGLSHSFGYILDKAINKQCMIERFAPILARRDRFEKWRIDNNKEITTSIGWPNSEADHVIAVKNWWDSHPAWQGIDGGEVEQRLFLQYNRDLERDQQDEYNLVEPYVYEDEHTFDEGSLRYLINEALKETITDLLRPVYVRDVPINPYGVIDDDKVKKSVSAFKDAGIGLDTLRKKKK
jgi:hypothetical protein